MKLTESKLRELIREMITSLDELEFNSEDELSNYKKHHKIRKGTKITVKGKGTQKSDKKDVSDDRSIVSIDNSVDDDKVFDYLADYSDDNMDLKTLFKSLTRDFGIKDSQTKRELKNYLRSIENDIGYADDDELDSFVRELIQNFS